MPVTARTDSTTFETHGARFHAYVAPSRGSSQLCAWRLEVPPGLVGVPHRPTREEVLLVLDGALHGALEGDPFALAPGDVLLVPADSELRVDGGPGGASVWVTTSAGVEAITAGGERLRPAWAQ